MGLEKIIVDGRIKESDMKINYEKRAALEQYKYAEEVEIKERKISESKAELDKISKQEFEYDMRTALLKKESDQEILMAHIGKRKLEDENAELMKELVRQRALIKKAKDKKEKEKRDKELLASNKLVLSAKENSGETGCCDKIDDERQKSAGNYDFKKSDWYAGLLNGTWIQQGDISNITLSDGSNAVLLPTVVELPIVTIDVDSGVEIEELDDDTVNAVVFDGDEGSRKKVSFNEDEKYKFDKDKEARLRHC